jgi:hypothetical protein
MYQFGKPLFDLSKADEAKDLLRQALQLHVKVLGLEDRNTLSVKKLLEEHPGKSSREPLSAALKPEEAIGNLGEEAVEVRPPKSKREPG